MLNSKTTLPSVFEVEVDYSDINGYAKFKRFSAPGGVNITQSPYGTRYIKARCRSASTPLYVDLCKNKV